MWLSIDIFKSCMRTPKSGKVFCKSQGILKSWSAGHPVLISNVFKKERKKKNFWLIKCDIFFFWG